MVLLDSLSLFAILFLGSFLLVFLSCSSPHGLAYYAGHVQSTIFSTLWTLPSVPGCFPKVKRVMHSFPICTTRFKYNCVSVTHKISCVFLRHTRYCMGAESTNRSIRTGLSSRGEILNKLLDVYVCIKVS